MSKRHQEQEKRGPVIGLASPFESGVIPKDLTDEVDPDHEPPWPVVQAYLATGEHRLWVEGWAARSPSFADVLEALRHDDEDRAAPSRPDNVVPFRR
jgi:hypothetical protein